MCGYLAYLRRPRKYVDCTALRILTLHRTKKGPHLHYWHVWETGQQVAWII